MPRPAKPPMTLKEAKRAYKKDGGIVRYTASQMARADRIDAKDAKRKKELDKEKQRVGNKRKREEKEEKDRRVKQKMLDEGRITVEDTWGKVTASQPRLNMFFGRPGAAKSRLTNEVNVDEDDEDDTLPASADGTPPPEDDPEETEPAVVSEAAQDHSLTPDEETTVPLEQPLLSPSGSQNRILKELGPARLNAQISAPVQSSLERKSVWVEKSTTPSRSSLYVNKPGSNVGIEESSQFSTNVPRRSQRGNVIVDATTALSQPKRDVAKSADMDVGKRLRSPPPGAKSQSEMHEEEKPRRSLSMSTDEEDFTDGIDDATFLMLCATQKPAAGGIPKELSSKDSGAPPPSTLKAPNTESSSKTATPAHDLNASVHTRSEPANNISGTLTESFTSVFEEIEDEDLIALAEEVEAGQSECGTPQQTLSLSAQKKTNDSISQKVNPPSAARGSFKQHASSPLPTGTTAMMRPASSSAPNRERSRGDKLSTGPSASKSFGADDRRKLPPSMNPSRAPLPGQRKGNSTPTPQIRSINSRAMGTNPRAVGTNVRATNTNPRATGTNIQFTGTKPSRTDPKPRPKTQAGDPRIQAENTTSRPTPTTLTRPILPKPNHQFRKPQNPHSPPAFKLPPPPPPSPPTTNSQPKPKRKRRFPLSFDQDEFPDDMGFGPGTQAAALDLLAQEEKKYADTRR